MRPAHLPFTCAHVPVLADRSRATCSADRQAQDRSERGYRRPLRDGPARRTRVDVNFVLTVLDDFRVRLALDKADVGRDALPKSADAGVGERARIGLLCALGAHPSSHAWCIALIPYYAPCR